MSILNHLGNALVIPPALFFTYNFYKFRGKQINFRGLWISIILLAVTTFITGLQFLFPEIIAVLDRNKEALLSGEWWRLITPLFVQPLGVWQCFFNGVFFMFAAPIGEHFYHRGLLLIYFGAGLVGQLVNFYWESPIRGGSSTAIFGVMGSLFVYIVVHRKTFPKGYIFLSVAAFIGAPILCFFKDGHAPALLTGALLAGLLHLINSEENNR